MTTDIKQLPKGLVEIAIAIPPDELRPFLERAATALAEATKIEGFRPGKAPYAVVVARYGEMRVYEAAAEFAVRATYAAAVREHKIPVIGEPAVAVKTLAPGNPLVFTATAPALPAVTKLPDYRAVRVPTKPVDVTDAAVDRALADLQKMQTKETAVERAATASDKVVLNVGMSRDNVPIEGGSAKDHEIYLSESYYIPGFTAEIVGLKRGDEKKFSLPFPKEHFQKTLAGKVIDFDVSVQSVFELAAPALDDAFAATLGKKTLAELQALVKKNLADEAEAKESERQEIAVLEELLSRAQFGDIPELMIADEINRMLKELEAGVQRRGLSFDDYLASIKKTRDEVGLGLAPQAVKRIKTALLIREIGAREAIEPTEQEVSDEVARHADAYRDDAAAQTAARKPEYAAAVRSLLRNRQVIAFLKKMASGVS